jgi:hypothetical protein
MFGNTNPFKPSLNLCGYIPRGLPRQYFCFWAFDAARQFTICLHNALKRVQCMVAEFPPVATVY